MLKECQRSFYVEGSARPGTQPSIYDPSNVMGGAKHTICGKAGFALGRAGVSLCKEHAQEEIEFLAKNNLSTN